MPIRVFVLGLTANVSRRGLRRERPRHRTDHNAGGDVEIAQATPAGWTQG
ncbi:MAG: hypothetical protein JXR84_01095 [Anaerolineae bacterium]|nr:hypothetical protein [Anaerolineae bacterium]